ncbi:hypothetical protein AB0885_33855, partial [Streptomyces sp. NPDC005534]
PYAQHGTVDDHYYSQITMIRTIEQILGIHQPVLVNGEVGVIALVDGRPLSVMGITVVDGRIVALHILADPDRLARLGVAGPGE